MPKFKLLDRAREGFRAGRKLAARAFSKDRHRRGLFSARFPWTGKAAGVVPRNYYLLAGAYLVTIVLLLAGVLLRWSSVSVPGPADPEGGPGYGITKEVEGDDLEAEGRQEHLEDGLKETEGNNGYLSGEEEDTPAAGPLAGEEITLYPAGLKEIPAEEMEEMAQAPQAQGDNPAAGEEWTTKETNNLLPPAASPLPQWSLNTPFGSYASATLPSGGKIHWLTRGVLLKATPGAPVSALWDGIVVKTTSRNSPLWATVLLEHEGGYATFYAQLQETWVEEGQYVSRGEHIGLMPAKPLEKRAFVPALAGEQEESEKLLPREAGGGIQVPIRTIYGGYRKTENVATQGQAVIEKGESGNNSNPIFREEVPLLYLEVRYRRGYLDPLSFLKVRN